MVQRIWDFAEGMRRGLAIRVRCECGIEKLHPSRDLLGCVAPGAEIEDLRWRCALCGRRSTCVRCCLVHDIDRDLLEPWTSPRGLRRWL